MVERPHTGQLPPAHPVAYGSPPVPDGDTIPQPAAAPPRVTFAERLPVLLCAAVVALAVLIGALR